MKDVLWAIFELLVNLYQGVLFAYFIWKSLGNKYGGNKNRILFMLCSLSYFIAVTVANYITAFEGFAIFVYATILFIFSLFALNSSILKKVLASIIPISAMAICVAFSTNIISLIFDEDIINLISVSSVYRLYFVVLSNTLMFIFLYIVKLLFNKNDISLSKTEWIMLGLVFSISIIIFALLFFIVFSGISKTGEIYIALNMLLIIAINLIVYFLLVQLSKKHKIEMENNLLMQQYKFQKQSANEINLQYQQLQKTRHDYNNGLRVIQTLNSENKSKEIDEYISKYLVSENRSIHIISTKNEYINAIINSKIAQATANDIEVTVNTAFDIEYTDNIDLCNIIGNMFDNAIEACKKCIKNKIIQLKIEKDDNNIIIFMKNSISNSVINKNPRLLTDKKDKTNHGYGTKIIKELAEKHHGFADFYEDGNYFCCNVNLLIY